MIGRGWWSLVELESSEEVFVPRELAVLLPPLLHGDFPATPIEISD